MTKTNRVLVGLVSVFAALVAFTGVASATTTIDPVAETTGFLADGVAQIAPIMIAVVGGALVLLALNVGLRMAWKAVRAKGASAG